MAADNIDAQRAIILDWVSKAYWKDLKSFEVPEKYKAAAEAVASEGNGFRFDGKILSWD